MIEKIPQNLCRGCHGSYVDNRAMLCKTCRIIPCKHCGQLVTMGKNHKCMFKGIGWVSIYRTKKQYETENETIYY